MKFTDGYWLPRPGVTVLRPRDVADVEVGADDSLTVYASTVPLTSRGDTLNKALVTVSFASPMDDVIGVRIEHHRGGVDRGPALRSGARRPDVKVVEPDGSAVARPSGALTARVSTTVRGLVEFEAGRSGAHVVDRSLDRRSSPTPRATPTCTSSSALGVREHVYGLGERFGAFVKNGQSVDIWNEDGGTASEQAYKNVPFYLSDAGYGVFVDHPGAGLVRGRVRGGVPHPVLRPRRSRCSTTSSTVRRPRTCCAATPR